MQNNQRIDGYKLVTAILIGVYFFYCAANPLTWHFIDNIDLVLHEAGHPSLWFFGQLVSIIGGSLFQILVPLVFSLYFYGKSDVYASSLIMMWAGYNFINVSVYINDAIAMQLPLLGGDYVIHDWNYILNAVGFLDHAHNLAALANGLGFTIITLSLVIALYYSRKSSNESFE